MNIKQKLEQAIGKDNILYNESMSKHTTFKVGGLAEILIKIERIEQIKKILEIAKEEGQQIHILGNGSNLLVQDDGVKGIVLKIAIKGIETREENGKTIIKIGAGEKVSKVAQQMLQNSLTGFEEISGIPGTIGGAVRMNAGAHGKEIKDIIVKAKAIDYNGKEYEFNKEEMQLDYRTSIFAKENYIIYEVEIELQKGNKEEIESKMKGYMSWRREHQPLEYPNAGSTFKRGEDYITAKLIDDCGLKGYQIGGAQISTKHAGFIINTGNATAKEILELIEYAKEQVYEKFGKDIKLEVEIW